MQTFLQLTRPFRDSQGVSETYAHDMSPLEPLEMALYSDEYESFHGK